MEYEDFLKLVEFFANEKIGAFLINYTTNHSIERVNIVSGIYLMKEYDLVLGLTSDKEVAFNWIMGN